MIVTHKDMLERLELSLPFQSFATIMGMMKQLVEEEQGMALQNARGFI